MLCSVLNAAYTLYYSGKSLRRCLHETVSMSACGVKRVNPSLLHAREARRDAVKLCPQQLKWMTLFQVQRPGAGEMAQWLKALTTQ